MNPSPTPSFPPGLPLPADLGLSARGVTADEALALAAVVNEVTTGAAASQDGVRLPRTGAPYIVVRNDTGGAINVYPPQGGQIDDAAVDAAYAVADNKTAVFFRATNTRWFAIVTA